MKNLFSFSTVFILLFGSSFLLNGCSDTTIPEDSIVKEPITLHSKFSSSASNPQNPYDLYGQVMDSLVASYSLLYTPSSDVSIISSRVNSLIKNDAFYHEVYTKNPSTLSYSRVATFLNDPMMSPTNALQSSTLRADVQTTLRNFITSFSEMVLSSASDASVYETVRGFESQVLSSTYYTSFERQELLQAASVARYTAYRKRKKPKKNTDPDWTVLIVHISSSIDATVPETADRFYQSLVVGLAANSL